MSIKSLRGTSEGLICPRTETHSLTVGELIPRLIPLWSPLAPLSDGILIFPVNEGLPPPLMGSVKRPLLTYFGDSSAYGFRSLMVFLTSLLTRNNFIEPMSHGRILIGNGSAGLCHISTGLRFHWEFQSHELMYQRLWSSYCGLLETSVVWCCGSCSRLVTRRLSIWASMGHHCALEEND